MYKMKMYVSKGFEGFRKVSKCNVTSEVRVCVIKNVCLSLVEN